MPTEQQEIAQLRAELATAQSQRADFRRQLTAEREGRLAAEKIVDEVRARNRELEASPVAMAQPSSERHFPICKDHVSADWNQPQLDDNDCILCRLFYLEAQEGLLEEWQQRAKRAEDAIAEVKRPLDDQMARLNATVTRLNEENDALRSAMPRIVSTKPLSELIELAETKGYSDEFIGNVVRASLPMLKPIISALASSSAKKG